MAGNTLHNPSASVGGRRLAWLVVPAPSAYEPPHRIDWIQDPLPPADADEAADEAANKADEAADGAHGYRHPDA